MFQKSRADLDEGDRRRILPRFSDENFPKILKLVDGVKAIAEKYNAKPGQVALAWLLAQGDDVIPIPGTTKVEVRRVSAQGDIRSVTLNSLFLCRT